MTLLNLDWSAEDLVERYSGFTYALTWFRMYCAAEFAESKQDYVKGFRFLEEHYEHLWDTDEQVPLEWRIKSTVSLMKSIKAILKSKSFTSEHAQKIASLIRNYQNDDESDFRKTYIDGQVEYHQKLYYPKGLSEAVRDLLGNDKTDEAIVTAFKYLDNHLQKLTGASAYEFYGEELINHAFAPKNGVLQIGTDPNEQVGLRNLFSGANAIFRNPSAHRFNQHDPFFAAAVVAMVAAMTEMASDIAKKNLRLNAG